MPFSRADAMTETLPNTPFRLPTVRRASLFAAPVLLIAAVGWSGFRAWAELPNQPSGPYSNSGLASGTSLPDADAENPDGYKLFQFHCANCHGARGDGVGLAGLNPRARYFGYDKFKFISTLNPAKTGGGMPTDDDLYRTIKGGIAGSPMPSFGHLPEAQLRALAAQVKKFVRVEVIVRRMKDIVKAKADASEEGFDEKSDWSPVAVERMRLMAVKEVEAGLNFELPDPFPASSMEAVARGKLVFAKAACVSCHGNDGKGDGPQSKDPKFLNENGTRAFPRDLTAGLFKGGGDPHHLYSRVFLGIPGTPMPISGLTLKQQELIDLVHFVKSLEQ